MRVAQIQLRINPSINRDSLKVVNIRVTKTGYKNANSCCGVVPEYTKEKFAEMFSNRNYCVPDCLRSHTYRAFVQSIVSVRRSVEVFKNRSRCEDFKYQNTNGAVLGTFLHVKHKAPKRCHGDVIKAIINEKLI